MQEEQEEQVVCKDRMQIMKGKRTKRQRVPSPLRLTMSTTCSSAGRSSTENSIGFDVTTDSHELRNRTEEEEDMANCLILLAQGHHTPKASQHVVAPNNKGGLYLYECKTCNRCFPSFQALGGHRASHKKPKANTEEKTSFLLNEVVDHNDHYEDPTSTTLTLQLSTNKAFYNNSSSSTTSNTTKSKVHECSICGAEFTSGQALGGHMRRHRNFGSTSAAISMSGPNAGEAKKHKHVLDLDLNLPPAPEDDHSRESKLFPFQSSKEKVIIFSTTSLVDCHN